MTSRAGYTGGATDGVEHYLGIQYAQLAPEGRFSRADRLADAVQLDVEALEQVPVFPQLPSRLATALGRGAERNPQSESAFFLNVWTPTSGSRLPVLFFIHGGAWMTGAGSATWYDGQALSARGVVVVTVNYRLGPLAHVTEAGAGRERNPAFTDLLAALHWVREHIADFGGDPDAITVAGQSAGSWYAHLLSISEQARGLFTRVAHLSHASNRAWTSDYQDELSREVRTESGAASLHDLSSADLLAAGMGVLSRRPAEFAGVPTPYLPTTEPSVADVFCDAQLSASASHARAVYLRTTGTETSAFMFQSPREREVNRDTVERIRAAAGVPSSLVAGGADTAMTPYEQLVAVTSEIHFDGPARRLADAYAGRGVPTHLRTFDVRSDLDGFLSGHCLDLPFQFGCGEAWADAPMLTGMSRDLCDHVSSRLIDELVDFVAAADGHCELPRHRDGDDSVQISL